MTRKIIMTGNNARYIRNGKQPNDTSDREIIMTGDNATIIENNE